MTMALSTGGGKSCAMANTFGGLWLPLQIDPPWAEFTVWGLVGPIRLLLVEGYRIPVV